MTNLAIIIVSWNVRELLTNCLHSLEADLSSANLSAQIWVVDNASTDGTVEILRQDFPQVHLIASTCNLGFAAGNNAALRALGFNCPASESSADLPEMVLLLNPDTKVHPGALAALVNFLKRTPDAGIAGANLEYGDGSFQDGAFAFPGLWQLAIELLPLPSRLAATRLNGRYARELYRGEEAFEIGHPLGAAMCVRREAILQIGLLNEQYHMYVEEVDWSKRIVSAGWRAYCVPTAVITHYGGQSTEQIKLNSFINLWRGRYLFYREYYSGLKVWLARHIVQIGMARLGQADRQARTQGHLTEAALIERLNSYRNVVNIWQGK